MVSRIASSAAGKKKIGRINKKGAHLSLFFFYIKGERWVGDGRWVRLGERRRAVDKRNNASHCIYTRFSKRVKIKQQPRPASVIQLGAIAFSGPG